MYGNDGVLLISFPDIIFGFRTKHQVSEANRLFP